MSRQQQAQILTAAVLAVALGIVAYRKSGAGIGDLSSWFARPAARAPMTPQDVIYSMLDAAREGNVPQYLAAYTGQMETALKKTVAESSEEAFAKYLRQTNEPIKGIALQEPEKLTDREVKVRVEYVFADRNEVQYMYLEKVGETWKIARVDATERIPTLVPYGTPVQ